MQRQVLVIQKAPRTADVPLLQYCDTTVDVSIGEATPRGHHRKQHEDCITKYNENPDRQEAAFSKAQDRKQEAESLRQ